MDTHVGLSLCLNYGSVKETHLPSSSGIVDQFTIVSEKELLMTKNIFNNNYNIAMILSN